MLITATILSSSLEQHIEILNFKLLEDYIDSNFIQGYHIMNSKNTKEDVKNFNMYSAFQKNLFLVIFEAKWYHFKLKYIITLKFILGY